MLSKKLVLSRLPMYAARINNECFKDRLDLSDIDFYIEDCPLAFGYCDGYSISISRIHCKTLADVFLTLAHELIHIDQFQKDKKLNHKKYFRKMAKKICTVYPWIEWEKF